MDVKAAARHTRVLLEHSEKVAELPPRVWEVMRQPARSPKGLDLAHQLWLLQEVEEGRVTDEKAHRWLSWTQGVLSAQGYLTLDQCKIANLLA